MQAANAKVSGEFSGTARSATDTGMRMTRKPAEAPTVADVAATSKAVARLHPTLRERERRRRRRSRRSATNAQSRDATTNEVEQFIFGWRRVSKGFHADPIEVYTTTD